MDVHPSLPESWWLALSASQISGEQPDWHLHLIRSSFVPPPDFREARELTRFRRQLIQARTSIRNEVIRLLARQGITLSDVLSDVFGVSGMAILEALAEGRSVLDDLPKLIHYRLRPKLAALGAAAQVRQEREVSGPRRGV